ncbi:MAG: DUF2147 domain-containing protein [Deltaproteobacteria bacterium HGW-Deltaproteobacteria-13]|jgi:uncharacterized protein (DUF2147 family)|nr:MAG: DUF2147 domain-containing protein [Deltaproteobacteria bacterium HGW-Deltaproteobacteria-13]
MKKIIMSVMICMFVVVFFSAAVKAQEPIVGTWITIGDQGADKGKQTSYIEIFEKDGLYFGKITKLLTAPEKDNPNQLCVKCSGDLKNKPIVGMVILKNMKKTGKVDAKGLEYSAGRIMDPDNGETYKCTIWVKDDILTSRGYIGISLLGRSVEWLRLKK